VSCGVDKSSFNRINGIVLTAKGVQFLHRAYISTSGHESWYRRCETGVNIRELNDFSMI
jgi:hypothetical protein